VFASIERVLLGRESEMKNVVFALVIVLAMSSVTFAAVIVDYVELDYVENTSPGPGLRSYTVQATGIGITTLSTFEIQGNVNQEFLQGFPFSLTQSPWLGDGSADPGSTGRDSYVIFGDLRIEGDYPDIVTTETVLDGSASGPGTLNNHNDNGNSGGNTWIQGDFNGDGQVDSFDATLLATNYYGVYPSLTPGDADLDGLVDDVDATIVAVNWGGDSDAYLKTGMPSMASELIDLMQLVIPEGGSVDIALTLYTATNYDPETGMSDVTQHDLEHTVPEPGSIVMLMAAGMCLCGYWLRKKLR
jgi:hypothetical protein